MRQVVLGFAMAALLSGTAAAQCPPDGGAALSEHAARAMREGDYKTACPLLQQSYECDDKPGRLYALARCKEAAGSISTATRLYEQFLLRFAQMDNATREQYQERADLAKERSRAIQLDVPRVTLRLSAKAPHNTSLTLDGQEVPDAKRGVPFDIDPGEHTVTTKAPLGGMTSTQFEIARRERKQIELEVKLPRPEPGSSPTGLESGTRRVGIYAISGVSLAALAIGAIAGLIAFDKAFDIRANCMHQGSDLNCPANYVDPAAEAQAVSRLSTVGFTVGLTGAAIVTVLVATETSPGNREQPTIPGSGTLMTFQGVW